MLRLTSRERIFQGVQGLLRKTLERMVLRDDAERTPVCPNAETAKEDPDVLLIMELGSDPHCQAFHRERLFGSRHQHLQMNELEKRGGLALSAHEALHGVAEPVCLECGLDGLGRAPSR